MENGQVAFKGNIDDSLNYYLSNTPQNSDKKIIECIKDYKPTFNFTRIMINGSENTQSVVPSAQHTLSILIEGEISEDTKTDVLLFLKTKDGIPLASLAEGYYKGRTISLSKGKFRIEKELQLPKYLSNGQLHCDLMMHYPRVEWHLQAPDCCCLDCEGYQEEFGYTINQSSYGFMGLEEL